MLLAAGLLCHFRDTGPPVATSEAMALELLCTALRYGFNSLALQDAAFVMSDLKAHTAMGNIFIIPWVDVWDLPGFWISPLGFIPQEDRRPRIIYNYLWIGLNVAVLRQAPAEVVQFAQTLPRLLRTILDADPQGGPVFMSKIELSGTYVRVWMHPEDLPLLSFVFPSHPEDDDTLIGFHLSLPIVYVDSSLYFLCTIDTVADLSNLIWSAAANTAPYPLSALTDTPMYP